MPEARRGGPLRVHGSKCWQVAVAVLAVAIALVLRHDFWQWTTARPLLFGVLPVGLWWQAGVSVLASVAMALLVHWAWPSQLEEELEPRPPGAAEPPRPDEPAAS